MLGGDFNVEPLKIPSLAKGMSAWLWVDLEYSWGFRFGEGTCGYLQAHLGI